MLRAVIGEVVSAHASSRVQDFVLADAASLLLHSILVYLIQFRLPNGFRPLALQCKLFSVLKDIDRWQDSNSRAKSAIYPHIVPKRHNQADRNGSIIGLASRLLSDVDFLPITY